MDGDIGVVVGLLVLAAIVFPIVFLPTIIAFRRRHPNRWVILIINGFLGPVGGLGWLLALAWAFKVFHRSPLTEQGLGTDGGESGLNLFANDEQKISIVNEIREIRWDIAEELTKVKQLLDEGILTRDEFELAKSEILRRYLAPEI